MADETSNTAEIETSDEISSDSVCRMPVDIELAREADLITEFAEREYAFCGPACRDRFLATPAAYAVAGRGAP